MSNTILRNQGLPELVQYLQNTEAHKRDVIVSSKALHYDAADNVLELNEYSHDLTDEGVTRQEVITRHGVNIIAERQLRGRVDIPHSYWERMRKDAVSLLDTNVNHWLQADERNLMLRTLVSDDADPVVRAILSDRYRILDDLDVLTAALDGVRASEIVDPSALDINCDYTGTKMYVKITAPEIAVAAEDLVSRYRDQRSGNDGRDHPMVWAGLVISNSETGHGTASITPRVVMQVCKNGMTRKQDVSKSVHLGERLDQGVVTWSEETQRKQLELITLKTRDSVKSFLSTDYVERVVAEMREMAAVKIVSDQKQVVEVVGKTLGYTQQRQDHVFASFMGGGDYTALGVAQAITHAAQDVEPDEASDMEGHAWKAMELAAAAAR